MTPIASRELPLLSPGFPLIRRASIETDGDIVRPDYDQNITRRAIDYLNTEGTVIRSIVFTGSGQLIQNNDEGASFCSIPGEWLLIEAPGAVVDNAIGGATFFREYNGQPRALNFRFDW